MWQWSMWQWPMWRWRGCLPDRSTPHRSAGVGQHVLRRRVGGEHLRAKAFCAADRRDPSCRPSFTRSVRVFQSSSMASGVTLPERDELLHDDVGRAGDAIAAVRIARLCGGCRRSEPACATCRGTRPGRTRPGRWAGGGAQRVSFPGCPRQLSRAPRYGVPHCSEGQSPHPPPLSVSLSLRTKEVASCSPSSLRPRCSVSTASPCE